MIDPEAIYTLKDCVALTGRSYQQVTAAVQRGLLRATRSQGTSYQVRGGDLIAWRDRAPTPRAFAEPVYRPLPGGASPGEQIRTLRRGLGLTQAQFADHLGCARSTVASWESGRIRPSTESVTAIHHLLAQLDGPGRP